MVLAGPITLTPERLLETMDDMVRRGRLTRPDAQDLLLALTGQGGEPLPGYDALTAAEVTRRLAGLTPAQLRRVREHEAARANRRTVLAAVERRLRVAS